MNRQRITGSENVVTIKVSGGRDVTLIRDGKLWSCSEFPLPKPTEHLRYAVAHVRRVAANELGDPDKALVI